MSWRRHAVTTPAPLVSANRTSAEVASSKAAISPAITSGWRAPATSRAASRTPSGAGTGRRRGGDTGIGASPAPASVTSSGSTTTTGPGRPATDSRIARAVHSATSAPDSGSSTALATGAYMRW